MTKQKLNIIRYLQSITGDLVQYSDYNITDTFHSYINYPLSPYLSFSSFSRSSVSFSAISRLELVSWASFLAGSASSCEEKERNDQL